MNAATIILQQLGGNKFLTMTGSYNLFHDNNGNTLTMHLRRNKAKAKYLQITLNSLDLYDVKFTSLKDYELIEKASFQNVYGDMLQNIFTSVTGLNTCL